MSLITEPNLNVIRHPIAFDRTSIVRDVRTMAAFSEHQVRYLQNGKSVDSIFLAPFSFDSVTMGCEQSIINALFYITYSFTQHICKVTDSR